jgi:hypothetical protein
MKIHLKVPGVDCRGEGQTQYEYDHQTACGYVRKQVVDNPKLVTCNFCKRTDEYKSRA